MYKEIRYLITYPEPLNVIITLMTIGFALLLNHETHNFIRQIQVELNHQFGYRISRQYPHVTIKSPFEIDRLESFVDYLENLARNISPFEVQLKGFNHIGEKVLFLDVAENAYLTNLHHQILSDLEAQFGVPPHEFEGKNIHFHASIAGYSSTEDFHRAYDYLHKYQPDFTFLVKSLGIFYHLGGDDGWMVLRKIGL